MFYLLINIQLTVVYFNCVCFSLIVDNVAVRLFFLALQLQMNHKAVQLGHQLRQNYTQNRFSHGGYLIWKWFMVFACGLLSKYGTGCINECVIGFFHDLINSILYWNGLCISA